jgi:hypothetical protein
VTSWLAPRVKAVCTSSILVSAYKSTASSLKINIDEDHFRLLPKTFMLKSVDYVMRAVTVTVIIVFLS